MSLISFLNPDAIADNSIGLEKIKTEGKVLSDNNYTTEEKTKLAGIAAGANNYTLPVATSGALGGVKSGTDITVDGNGNVSVVDDSHNHVISNVDGLQTALDGKAAASHTHTKSQITDFPTSLPANGGYADGITSKGKFNSQEKIDNFITANKLEYAMFQTTESNNVDFANNDGMLISIPWSQTTYGVQLAFDDTINGTIKVRGKSNSWGAWYTLLQSGNFNSYAPKLDGTGAKGTWSISITGSAGSVAWGNVTGKPTTFTPSTHVHPISEVTNLQITLDAKAPLASPALTGTPTAPTAASGTNTTQIATTAFVVSEINNKIAAADAMIYKGTIGTGGTVTALPSTTAKTGWTYKVITAGSYAGQTCEVGDMIVCLTDGSPSVAATWTVIQTNIDGAVIGPSSATDGQVALFNGTSGKSIKAVNASTLTVGTANKTANSLSLKVGSTTKTFDGSSAVSATLSSNSITIPVPKVYETTTSTNTTSIPASTHGCGDKPIVQCYEDGAVVVCAIVIDGSGNITIDFNGTHTVKVRVIGMGTQTLSDFIKLT